MAGQMRTDTLAEIRTQDGAPPKTSRADAGRSFGIDSFLAGPLERAAARGSRLAWLICWLV